MTSRERLTTILKGGEADRIPWSPLMDYYFIDSLVIEGKHPDVADAARMMGADHLERHVPVFDFKMEDMGYEIISKGNEDLVRYTTPVGKLEQVLAQAGHTRSVTKHMIETQEDLKVLKYIIEHTYFEPNHKYFLERESYIGQDGVATTSANNTPIKYFMDNYTGLENFTYLLYDYESDMHEVMEMLHQKTIEQLKIIIDSPAEFIFSYEDTSTTVLSEDWYKKYCVDNINEYADLVHKAGKVFITHMCGKLKGFSRLISEGRMDGIDSVCPPTTGDLWAHEALEAFQGKVVIGGIEPSALQRMSADETERYVEDVLDAVSPGKRFILSTGDAVPWGTPIENMIRVGEVVARRALKK